MSLPLHAYSWAGEPLCAEAPQRKEDTVAEGSDIEDEPSAKEERQRRREAIGRAYLKGHMPFLLSTQLRGPFDRASGWINPWKKVRKVVASPPISGEVGPVEITKIQAHATSKTFAFEPCHGDARRPSRKRLNRSPISLVETGHYDADDEGVKSEQSSSSAHRMLDAQRLTESGHLAPPAQLRCQHSQQVESEEDILQTSQEDLERLIERKRAESLGNALGLSQEWGRKRAADLSWLKGAHIIKRSRHEMPENPTPTPVGGSRRASNKRKRRSSVALSAESLLSRHSPSLRSPKANSAPPEAQMHLGQSCTPVVREGEVVSLELEPSAVDCGPLIWETVAGIANIASIGDPLYGSSAVSGSFQYRKAKRKRKAKNSSPERPPDEVVGQDLTDELAIESYGASMLSNQEMHKAKLVGLGHGANSDTKALTPQRPMNGCETHTGAKSQPRASQNYDRVCANDENSRTMPPDPVCNLAMEDQGKRSLESNTNLLVKLERQQQSPPRASSDDEAREQLIFEALSSHLAEPGCSRGPTPDTTSDSSRPNRSVRKSPLSHSYEEDTDAEVENLGSSNHSEESGDDNATSPTSSGGSQVQNLHTGDVESPCLTPSSSKHQRHKNPMGIPPLDNSGPSENHDILKQSPWTTDAVDSLSQFLSRSGAGANGGHVVDARSSGHSDQEVECDTYDTEIYSGSLEKLLIDGTHTPDNDDIGIFEEFLQSSPIKAKTAGQSLSGIPSTQVLVDAATANPWTSAFKKPKLAKCNKRVSFSPTALSNLNSGTPRSSLRQSRQLGSPPPPSGISAFQRLAVKEDLHVKLMNALQSNSSSRLSSAISFTTSPAVDAMAEAFITADRQSSTVRFGKGTRSDHGLLAKATHDKTSMPLQPQSEAANRGRDDPPSPNLSFSITPNGKVTPLNGGVDVGEGDGAIGETGNFIEGKNKGSR
jgi:hypothetical protein